MGSSGELHLLTNDNVETLCKVTHRPGGTVNNPNVPVPQAGLCPQLAKLGILVAQYTENNLKLASYYLNREKTSRIATPADSTLIDIHALTEHHDWESAHKDVEPLELTSNWPRNMENLDEYFHSCLGVTGIPLAYVVRENTKVLPKADDTAGNYASMQDELIACVQILTMANPNAFMAMYLTDHQHVWDNIAQSHVSLIAGLMYIPLSVLEMVVWPTRT